MTSASSSSGLGWILNTRLVTYTYQRGNLKVLAVVQAAKLPVLQACVPLNSKRENMTSASSSSSLRWVPNSRLVCHLNFSEGQIEKLFRRTNWKCLRYKPFAFTGRRQSERLRWWVDGWWGGIEPAGRNRSLHCFFGRAQALAGRPVAPVPIPFQHKLIPRVVNLATWSGFGSACFVYSMDS